MLGCESCCCVISDQFTRPDAPDPGDGWEVESGTPEILSNQLYFSAPGVAIWNSDNPRGDTGLQSASVKLAVTLDSLWEHIEYGARIRLILGRVDADNYIAAEYQERSSRTATDGYLAVVSRVAGIETVEKWEAFGATPSALYCCLRPQVGMTPASLTIWAWAQSDNTANEFRSPFCWHREVENAGGLRGGLAVMDGACTFDDWTFGKAFNDVGYGPGSYGHIAFPANDKADAGGPPRNEYEPCFDPTPHDCGNQELYIGHVSTAPFHNANVRLIDTTRWLHLMVHNRGSINVRLHTDMALAGGGFGTYQRIRLVFNSNATMTDYWYVESYWNLTATGSPLTLSIHQVVAGVDSQLVDDTMNMNIWTPRFLVVCIDGGDIAAWVQNYPEAFRFGVSMTGAALDSDHWYTGYITDATSGQWLIVNTIVDGVSDGSPWDVDCLDCTETQP